MLTMKDGPAARECFVARRAPLFLRVVMNPRARINIWDVLDEFDDVPKPHEVIHLYRRAGPPGRIHIRASRSTSGLYPMADYWYDPQPPPDEVLRDSTSWRKWCLDQCCTASLKIDEDQYPTKEAFP